MTNLYEAVGGMRTSQEVTDEIIRTMSEENRLEAAEAWHSVTVGRLRLGEDSAEEDTEQEAA